MNFLYSSLDAWNKSQQFVADAKAAVRETDKEALQYLAATYRAKFEIQQALYFAEVRP